MSERVLVDRALLERALEALGCAINSHERAAAKNELAAAIASAEKRAVGVAEYVELQRRCSVMLCQRCGKENAL